MFTSKKMREKLLVSSVITAVAVGSPLVVEASENNKPFLLGKQTLKYGQVGESVKALQIELKKDKLYNQKIDGVFGPLTLSAVRQFQKNNKLSVTGTANGETIHKLLSSTTDNVEESSTSLIKTGARGKAVVDIQKRLKELGYYQSKVDGIFGKVTYSAVTYFQRKNKIAVDGIVGKETLKAIQAEDVIPNHPVKIKKTKEVETAGTGLISQAKKHIGTPYKWGGTTPNGFDCSGFIKYVFKSKGYNIPRTVNEMWNFSTNVSKRSIGDLVFFETYKPGPSHAGIYIGNGRFIHAGSSNGVKISDLNHSYWKKRYIGSRRIIFLAKK